MAAGLRIQESRIDDFRDTFIEYCNEKLTGSDLKPRLRLDAEVPLSALDMSTVEQILALGPFGAGNPPPVFFYQLGEPRRRTAMRRKRWKASVGLSAGWRFSHALYCIWTITIRRSAQDSPGMQIGI